MMIYQHGIGYSKYGFVETLPYEDYIGVMQNAADIFKTNNLNEATLDLIYKRLIDSKGAFKNYVSEPTLYRNGLSRVQSEELVPEILPADSPEIQALLAKIKTNKPTQSSTQSTEVNKVLEGDIFALPGIPVITTNLGGVHGAGLAQAAKAKGLIKQGEGTFSSSDSVVTLPVKLKWSDDMSMNNNMILLQDSLNGLVNVAKANPQRNYLLPLAGLGHGEGSVEKILPLLINTVKAADNIQLVLPAEDVNLGRQGTVRKDYTRENMPKIKNMLKETGLLSNETPEMKRDEPIQPEVSNENAPEGLPAIPRSSSSCK
jgi:hypothetical protein